MAGNTVSFVSLVAPCFACRRLFASNPESVPSFRNEPICRDCVELVNAKRRASGLPEWPVAPDAYDAAESAY